MDKVERQVGIKGETLKTRLVSLLERGRWPLLDEELWRRFKVPEFDRFEFWRAIVVGREFAPSAFRCRAKEFRRMDPAERAQLLRWIAQILKRPLKAIADIISLNRRRRKCRRCSARHP